jgi:hypothetical protein
MPKGERGTARPYLRGKIWTWRAIMEKLAYNRSRADHKPENGAKVGGKAF